MSRIKLTAAGALAALGFLSSVPAFAGGPLLAPWALGHVIGAAARLAALPFIVASATQPVQGYQAPPAYGPTGYYAPPSYYPSAAYSAAPAYLPPYAYRGPQGYYLAPMPRHYPGVGYRGAYFGAPGRPFSQLHRGYSVPGMRYSASHGGQVFGRTRGYAGRHW
ncbi:MAG: hypothetical protein JO361_10505 [Gammaproteobacteria bacterium]|nr:hypothetical protein [Gammaproteobacteria bacterium]